MQPKREDLRDIIPSKAEQFYRCAIRTTHSSLDLIGSGW
jgi:hypothetical protein